MAFGRAVANDNFFFEKMRTSIAIDKTTRQSKLRKHLKTIEEYSRGGNASKIGKMQRQFFARNSDDSIFGAFGRNASLLALEVFNAPRVSLEELKATAAKFFGGTHPVAAHKQSMRPEPSFKTQSVSVEFASHVNDYITEKVKAAPESAQQVLDKDPLYMIPWADNVAPLKTAFHNGEITQELASQQLQRAILNNNGIHTVENGTEHFIKASKLYEMKNDFDGSTRNMVFGNTKLKIFNDEASLKPQETQQVFRFAPETPRPSWTPALTPAFR